MQELLRQPLSHYLNCFEHLNCDKRGRYIAPHKAVMLLAVIEGVRTGFITNGFVPFSFRMRYLFSQTWRRYVGVHPHYNCDFAKPFYHLSGEPFWHLITRPDTLSLAPPQTSSERRLYETYYGAMIPEDLCDYMAAAPSRDRLIRALTETYLNDHGTLHGFTATKGWEEDKAAEDEAGYGDHTIHGAA